MLAVFVHNRCVLSMAKQNINGRCAELPDFLSGIRCHKATVNPLGYKVASVAFPSITTMCRCK